MIHVLLGIDDTDNLESRGTGFRSRQLAQTIEQHKLGILKGITRHQLFFDRRIPYTSHNSSACLELMTGDLAGLNILAREFLLKESADGSDAGLAISAFDQTDEEIIRWGIRAKKEILTQTEARDIAKRKNMVLEGLTGTKDGIIGALAAIGLRKSGNDGRYIGVGGREIRELKGIYTTVNLFEEIRIDAVTDLAGKMVPAGDRIHLGDWMRPVLINHKITILADKASNTVNYEWQAASKEYIKGITG